MHIAVASHQPLPAKGYGGPQRVVMALVRGLAALGARVTLLAPPGTRVPEAAVGWRRSFPGSVQYGGEVDGTTKAALLARARCLWNPAQWDEPFGLVTVEALLSGTPVLGTRRGALPELISSDVGALCDTMEEIIAAAEQIHTRDPAACRAHAERFFTHMVMAEEYLRMYRHLLETGTLPAGRPTSRVPA